MKLVNFSKSCTGSPNTGVIGTMTVVTTVMRGTAHTLPVIGISLPVRMASAFIKPTSVMGIMTVEMIPMSWSTCAMSPKPRAPLISSSVIMGTASKW